MILVCRNKSVRSKSKDRTKSLQTTKRSAPEAKIRSDQDTAPTCKERKTRIEKECPREWRERSLRKLTGCHSLPETSFPLPPKVKSIKSSEHDGDSLHSRNRGRSRSTDGRKKDCKSKGCNGRNFELGEEYKSKSKRAGHYTGSRRSISSCFPSNEFSSDSRNGCFDREKNGDREYCVGNQQLDTYVVPLKGCGVSSTMARATSSSRNSARPSSRPDRNPPPKSTSDPERGAHSNVARGRRSSEIEGSLNRAELSISDTQLLGLRSDSRGESIRLSGNSNSRSREQYGREKMGDKLSYSDTNLLRSMESYVSNDSTPKSSHRCFYDKKSRQGENNRECKDTKDKSFHRSSSNMPSSQSKSSGDTTQGKCNCTKEDRDRTRKESPPSETELHHERDANPPKSMCPPSLEQDKKDSKVRCITLFRRSTNGFQSIQAASVDASSGSLKPHSKDNCGEGKRAGSDAAVNGFDSSCPLMERKQHSSPTSNKSIRKLHKSKSLTCVSQLTLSSSDEAWPRQDGRFRERRRCGRSASMDTSHERSTPLHSRVETRRRLSHSSRYATEVTPSIDLKTESSIHFSRRGSSGDLKCLRPAKGMIDGVLNQATDVGREHHLERKHQTTLTSNESDVANASNPMQGETNELDLFAHAIDRDMSLREMSLRELADALKTISVNGRDLLPDERPKIQQNDPLLGSKNDFAKTATSAQNHHQEQKIPDGAKPRSPRPPPRLTLPCLSSALVPISSQSEEKTKNTRNSKKHFPSPPPRQLSSMARSSLSDHQLEKETSLTLKKTHITYGNGNPLLATDHNENTALIECLPTQKSHETQKAYDPKRLIPPPPPYKHVNNKSEKQSKIKSLTSNGRSDLLVSQINELKSLSAKASTNSQTQIKRNDEQVDLLDAQAREFKDLNMKKSTASQSEGNIELLNYYMPKKMSFLKRKSWNNNREEKIVGKISRGDLRTLPKDSPPVSQTKTNDEPMKTGILRRKSSNINQELKRVADLPYNDRSGGRGLYSGEVDEWGRPHGEGKMRYDNGEYYSGRWTNGDKTGVHPSNLNFVGSGGAVGAPGVIYNGMMPYSCAGPMVYCGGTFFQENHMYPITNYREPGNQGQGQRQEMYPMLMNYPAQMHTPSSGSNK